jgi:protein phosphatase
VTPTRTTGREENDALRAAWASDLGGRSSANEDACVALPDAGLFIVSDGMGGEHAGALASSLVVDWAPALIAGHLDALESEEDRAVELAVRHAIVELNHRVRDESSRLDGVRRMGATVVLALVRGRRLHVAHMGDSRAYVFRRSGLELLTHDHSVAAVLHRRGALTSEQAARHPMRARLSRYVGMGGNAYADLKTLELRVGDRLLLCTDGLTEAVGDEEIAGALAAQEDLSAACCALADAAKDGGSPDNITVMIVESCTT